MAAGDPGDRPVGAHRPGVVAISGTGLISPPRSGVMAGRWRFPLAARRPSGSCSTGCRTFPRTRELPSRRPRLSPAGVDKWWNHPALARYRRASRGRAFRAAIGSGPTVRRSIRRSASSWKSSAHCRWRWAAASSQPSCCGWCRSSLSWRSCRYETRDELDERPSPMEHAEAIAAKENAKAMPRTTSPP